MTEAMISFSLKNKTKTNHSLHRKHKTETKRPHGHLSAVHIDVFLFMNVTVQVLIKVYTPLWRPALTFPWPVGLLSALNCRRKKVCSGSVLELQYFSSLFLRFISSVHTGACGNLDAHTNNPTPPQKTKSLEKIKQNKILLSWFRLQCQRAKEAC